MALHCDPLPGTPDKNISARLSFKILRFLFLPLLLATASPAATRMIAPNSWTQENAASYVSQLVYGTPSRRKLGQKRWDVYFVDLPAGSFIKVVAEQRGVDVTLKLFTPGGSSPIEEADSPTDTEGPESFTYVANQAGRFRIEVHSLEQQGEYEIKISELQPAGGRERARARADNLHRKAVKDVMAEHPSRRLEIQFEEEAVAVLENLSPPAAELADSLFHLGQLYRESSEQKKAQERLEKAMALREQAFGKQAAELTSVIDELGMVLQAQGKLDEAEKLFRQCIEIRERTDRDSVEAALARKNIADIFRERGNYAEARRLYRQSLDALEKKLPPEHVDFTLVLVPFGEFCRITADYSCAEQYFKRSLTLYENSPFVGPEHSNIALLLDKMAALYIQTADFKAADDCIQRARKLQRLFEKGLPPDNLDVVTANGNLGKLYFDRGKYAEAEEEYQRALRIRKEKLGEKHPLVASSLNSLAALYSERDQLAEAEDRYQQALAIRQEADGNQPSPQMADILSNLGSLYNKKGDYREAESRYREALEIRERTFAPDHPAVARSLNNLAAVLGSKAEAERAAQRDSTNKPDAQKHLQRALAMEADAETRLQHALQIQETKLNPDHPEVSITLFRLANLYSRQRRYSEAERAYERALSINRKNFGEGHPYAGRILNELANLYRDQGLEKQAESTYERSLKIQEQAMRTAHPSMIKLLGDFARHYQRAGNRDEAGKLLERSLDLIESSINRNLGAGSERQKLAYLATFNGILDQIIEMDAGADSRFGNLAFLALLRLKGRGLDEMVDRLSVLRSRAALGERTPLDKLRSVCSELSTLTWREPDPTSPATHGSLWERQTSLEKEKEKAEAEFGKVNPLHPIQPEPATVASVRKNLTDSAEETALVEFTVYHRQRTAPESNNLRRYAAYVLTKSGEPNRIELGDANAIEGLVNALRPMLRNKNSTEVAVKRLARQLDHLVMEPVRASLGEKTRRLLISPDGELNLIPFAALVDEGNQYLVKRYSITYLTSGRDLMRLQTPQSSKSQPLLVGNPAFGEISGAPTSLAANTRRASARGQAREPACDLSKIYFGQLSEARREVEAIRELLPQANVLSLEKATTEALRKVSGPSILHLATHGFFLCQGGIKNPLLRSGLAMAGFNQHKSGNDNGALMALEVAGLDLDGTKLAVLSACETGLGEIKNGEGVHGLRRALVLAGSESQVISLWEVSTYYTRLLMTDYYAGLLGPEKQGRGEALRQVQLKMLENKNLRHPFYWAGFIQSGEWANLEGKR